MLDEFKKFILKGNMIDLAVGVIIGGAFGKVVEKFTEFVMSIIGKILSTVGLGENAINGIKVGAVITQFINLLLVGFALFVLIKAYNRLLAKQDETPATPPPPPEDIKLLSEIRDLLRKQ